MLCKKKIILFCGICEFYFKFLDWNAEFIFIDTVDIQEGLILMVVLIY